MNDCNFPRYAAPTIHEERADHLRDLVHERAHELDKAGTLSVNVSSTEDMDGEYYWSVLDAGGETLRDGYEDTVARAEAMACKERGGALMELAETEVVA